MYRGQCPLDIDFTKSGQITSKKSLFMRLFRNFMRENTGKYSLVYLTLILPKVDIAPPPMYIRDLIFSRFFAEISWYGNSLKCILAIFAAVNIYIIHSKGKLF